MVTRPPSPSVALTYMTMLFLVPTAPLAVPPTDGSDVATLVRRLAASEVQQGLPAGVDERVATGASPAVQYEDGPTSGTALKCPPAGVGDALGVVLIRCMVNLMIFDRYGEPIMRAVLGQSLGDGPRAQHALVF